MAPSIRAQRAELLIGECIFVRPCQPGLTYTHELAPVSWNYCEFTADFMTLILIVFFLLFTSSVVSR